jgi:NAD(P)H-dependent FMN reductase
MLEIIQSKVSSLKIENVLWTLGDQLLPIMQPELRGRSAPVRDPRLRDFLTQAAASDGFVLGTPVYHDSYSGVLKNALDHLGSSDLKDKAFGLVSHGSQRTTQAVAHLRIVVRAVHGVAIPTQVCTDDDDLVIDPGGVVRGIKTDAVLQRVDRFCLELVRYATVFRAARMQESDVKDAASESVALAASGEGVR